MPDPPDRPSVSVILAVFDEAEFIDQVLTDLLGQDYTGPLQVIVADGGSDDGTREKLEAWAGRDGRVTVLHNPERRQAHGLNLAAERATGEILVRADGHTAFAPDYVRASVDALEETGGAVGGRMFPVGRTRFGRAVAAAMKSPLTMGPGRFHHSMIREEVDTVYLGAMRREWFETLGGFRAFPSGTSEDADLYFRWRRQGGKVYVDPSISSEYTPRDNPGALWRQYFRYGMGKAEMLWRNGAFPSWRPLAPLALVLGLLLSAVVGLLTQVWAPLLVLAGLWSLLLAWVAVRADEPAAGVLLAAGIMHLAYGLGELWGLVRGAGRHDSPRGMI
jgi:cellulose synthase/poly-beta-1,6-N-acetylglucosamine synthase-like glycosyltransferase